tara:strand:- start:25108 stop:25671 length:564 start_codon:yes stop_codon:yes gene_type:complete
LVSYSTSDFKPGLKILIDGGPCEIIEEEFVKPGKGQAFSKVKYRNLITGRVGEKTCKVGESLESADIVEIEMQYLYSEGTDWCFMNQETYDQVLISNDLIGENKDWLTEEDICKVFLWDGSPISVLAPNFVDLKIIETDPGVKGDTASGGTKPATLITGLVIKVPLFVSEGDIVTVDTRSGEYQGRK